VPGHPALGVDPKKRSVAASERDEAARAAGRQALKGEAVEDRVFVDEMGGHPRLALRSGWAPRGERAVTQVPRTHGQNTTRVAALSWAGVQAPWAIAGAIDPDAFTLDVREVLVPPLRPGPLVILDNLNVHTAADVARAITACGGRRRFRPADSPDLPPIEQAFSKITTRLRRQGARTRDALLDALLDALADALAAITPEDAHGWFKHVGYSPVAA
jgi:transposase